MENTSNDKRYIEAINIYYKDLKKECQEDICKIFNTTPEKEDWDVNPLFTMTGVVKAK